MAEHCSYGTIIQDMLRDRLVCELKHESIQQHIPGEGDTSTLAKSVETDTDASVSILNKKTCDLICRN